MSTCNACGVEVQPDFAFCPRCGTKMPARCSSCGYPLQTDFRFCPQCGNTLDSGTTARARAPLPTPAVPLAVRPSRPAEAETDRRVVTVLFADLAGFTALGTRLDPEDVRALQTDLFQELTQPIEEFDGFVEKYVGDAVMAVFGAPVAHENDPERALSAALAMHARMGPLSRRWEQRVGQPLTLHVGVNTGPVVAGTLESASSAAYAVSGDTVNTTSRLLGAAGAGETLVSKATYLQTQHAFTFEPLPDVTVKGKAEPLAVYRLRRLRSTPRPARGLELHGLAAPLVGRHEELRELMAAFERMLAGRAQVVSLVGEAGSGKSRLVREALARLDWRGVMVGTTLRQATCASLGQPTYGVLAAFLRQGYGVDLDDKLETARAKVVAGLQSIGGNVDEVAAVAPLVGYLIGLESRHDDVDPAQLKRRILLATRALFERRLERGPVVLIVEDLQWADSASIELLRFVADRLADRRLMLIVTHRPGFDAGGFGGGRANHTSLRLAPLSATDGEAILRSFFGIQLERWSAALCRVVIARAGGNPFYLEEIVRGLIDAGVLVREDAGWRCPPEVETVDVPPTIQALLLARLDCLPSGARRLLQTAAVLGHVFDARLLLAVASEPEECEAELEALVDGELLEELSPTIDNGAEVTTERRYRFSHALVQEVLYQNLLQRRRVELHGRAGQALERLVGPEPERLEDLEGLGRHFSLGGERARGARYLLTAGDRARAIYANEDAIRHYQRAREALAGCEGSTPDDVVARERLADVLELTGARAPARAHYEAAIADLAAAGDRPGQARLQRKLAWLHWNAGDRERARECCEIGLRLLEEHPRHIERAHLYQEMGRMAFRVGDNPGAREWAERALRHAQRLTSESASDEGGVGDRSREATLAVIHADNTLGIALARMNLTKEAVAHIERSAALAEAEELLHAACRSYSNLGVLYSTLDPGRAIATCQRGLEIAKRTGDVAFQSRLYANLAVAYCALTNRCDEAGIGAARTAIELDRRIGELDHLAVPLIVLAQIYQCHGQPGLARPHFQEALTLAEQAGDPQLLFPCYDGLAALHLETGQDALADEYMQKAQEICERTGLDPDSLVVLPFLE